MCNGSEVEKPFARTGYGAQQVQFPAKHGAHLCLPGRVRCLPQRESQGAHPQRQRTCRSAILRRGTQPRHEAFPLLHSEWKYYQKLNKLFAFAFMINR